MTSAYQASCDRGIAASAPAPKDGEPHPRLVLAATILASSLAFVDGADSWTFPD